MSCERKEHMKERGIDTDYYCINCEPNIKTGHCDAMILLKANLNHLAGCCMKGYPKLVET